MCIVVATVVAIESYKYITGRGAKKSAYGSTAAASPCSSWQFTPWFLVITSMGWIMMVFFCFADACTSLETAPYDTKSECESHQSVAVDAVLSVEGITFFQVRCEPVDV